MDRFIVYSERAYSVEWEGCAWLTDRLTITTDFDKRVTFQTKDGALNLLVRYEAVCRQ